MQNNKFGPVIRVGFFSLKLVSEELSDNAIRKKVSN